MSETSDFQQIQKQSLEMTLKQKASQMQVILGQLIEMNDDEIKDRIEMELDDNPALEEADSSSDDYNNDNDDDTSNSDDPFDTAFSQSDDDNDSDRNDDGLSFIQTKRRQGIDNDVYRPPVVNEASMYEVLMSQIRERDLDERQLLIAEYIIGEIDDDGLLRSPITSICGNIISKENEFVTPQEVEDVLEVIQDLEPAGIGATSTRECILLQIEDMKGVNIDIAQIAHTIVDKHFEEYDRLEDMLYEVFLTTYNTNSKTLQINGEGNPNYRFVFRPEEFFCKVDGAFFKKNTRVWGTLSILEEDSRDEICVVQITGFSSMESDYVEADSVIKCISNLARTLTRKKFWNMYQDDIYM